MPKGIGKPMIQVGQPPKPGETKHIQPGAQRGGWAQERKEAARKNGGGWGVWSARPVGAGETRTIGERNARRSEPNAGPIRGEIAAGRGEATGSRGAGQDQRGRGANPETRQRDIGQGTTNPRGHEGRNNGKSEPAIGIGHPNLDGGRGGIAAGRGLAERSGLKEAPAGTEPPGGIDGGKPQDQRDRTERVERRERLERLERVDRPAQGRKRGN
jgi:hypothetical protein